jgi:cell division protein FtsB
MAEQQSVAVSLGLAAGIVYLAAHAVMGQHGLLAFVELQAEEARLSASLAALHTEEAALVRRAGRLNGTLDVDYLDERARETLAAAGSGEVLFVLSNP